MFQMSADTLIAGLVTHLLPHEPGKALYVGLDIRRSVYDNVSGDEFGASRAVHFIVTAPSNYKRVYACVRDDWQYPEPEEYKLQSEHDSCWRTDGFRALSKVWGELDKDLDKQGAPKPERRDWCSYLLSGEPKVITIEEKRIAAEDGRSIITVIGG